ncbi:hypothetical protein LEP1GSC050_2506 [Leptospira broomii serovar Hurstbridge str. 5399]|uniref:Fibronectin type-III domain-containing protein n=1 Tax=Leptospira broomii serovar Hurstbridge str. 5399 TaxID=1049789 RepID=T0F0Z5_9LEPT|nr:fibronectin type III domain-containing protein [Leptospira broomii]EQA44825.1 hypothetical protein LEP1GSC050_2506 [Leptospira broomii serovar Hurstbridge str. 5399]
MQRIFKRRKNKESLKVFYFIIIFFSSFSVVLSEGRSFIYYIEWKEVKGSRGYLVEVRNAAPPQSLIVEKKVQENEIEFKLESGTYEYRIAALNRFGKPSSFTPWTSFKVEQDRPKEVALAEKEGLSKPKSSRVFVPGWGFYKNGEKLKAIGVWSGLAAVAFLGNAEREAGNRLASDPKNDPKVIGLLGMQLSPLSTLYLWDARSKDKSEYELHQRNQVALGGIAILGIVASLWWENRLPANQTLDLKIRPDIPSAINSSFREGFASRWEMSYTWKF